MTITLNLNIDSNKHLLLKMTAAANGITMTDILHQAIDNFILTHASQNIKDIKSDTDDIKITSIDPTSYHSQCLNTINNILNGSIVHFKKHPYKRNTDIKTDTTNYEVEILRCLDKFEECKFEPNRQNGLIITTSNNQIIDRFNEVYFFHNNTLIKIK